MRNVLLTLLAVLVVGILAALIFIYSGAYNVAATGETSAAQNWLFTTTMRRSVASRAKDIETPDLSDPQRLLPGASYYDSMCASCHGAPNQKPAGFAADLNPRPPNFNANPEDLDDWSPAEVFWVTKYGIEMTGMPAWGPSHDDEDLWDMVALMKDFPKMSAQDYQGLLDKAKASGHQHDHGAAGHAHDDEENAPGDEAAGEHHDDDGAAAHDHGAH